MYLCKGVCKNILLYSTALNTNTPKQKQIFHSSLSFLLSWKEFYTQAVSLLYRPQKPFSEFSKWAKDTSKNVWHISIHNFQPDTSIQKITNQWINASENIWVVSKVLTPIKSNIRKTWLSDTDINQIKSLENGEGLDKIK